MSVSLKISTISNEERWSAIRSGDFVLLDKRNEHPIPAGLYRVFKLPGQVTTEMGTPAEIFVVPMFDGPFEDGLFPYNVSAPYPKIAQVIADVKIEVVTVEQ